MGRAVASAIASCSRSASASTSVASSFSSISSFSSSSLVSKLSLLSLRRLYSGGGSATFGSAERRSIIDGNDRCGGWNDNDNNRFSAMMTASKKVGKRSVATTTTTKTTTETTGLRRRIETQNEGLVGKRSASSATFFFSERSYSESATTMGKSDDEGASPAAARQPSSSSSSSSSSSTSSSSSSSPTPTARPTTRVSETRVYYPGQTYDPSELEGSFASAAPSASQKTRRVLKKGKDLDALVARSIDWKDAKMLSTRFVSETGKIVPRRQTGLGAKTHRLVVKNIKIARIMGVLPFTDRLPQFARRRKNPYS